MQNWLFRIKVHTQCYLGSRFSLNLANTLQKKTLNMIKLRSSVQKTWLQSQRKEKGKNHKLPLSRHSLKFKMSSFVKFSHKIFPLFNRFSTFDKNVNLSKTNPGAKNFFLTFPSLNTSIFFLSSTDLKIASTLRPFERFDSKVTLPKYRSLIF
jgi:hypothetical protein